MHVVVAAAAILLLAAGLVLFLRQRPAPQTLSSHGPAPVKAGLTQEDTARSMAMLDNFLYGSLFTAGLNRDHIASTTRTPRSEGNHNWELKTIHVNLPDGVSIERVKNLFGKKGADFPVSASRKFTQNKTDAFTVEFMINGETTHRVTFSKPREYASLPPPPKRAPPPVHVTGRVAIIIDDMGLSREPAQELLELGVPITLSVFPLAPFTREIAEMANARGYPVMLHLPLEPHDYPEKNPGPGALYTTMDQQTMMAQLAKYIDSVPHMTGINNHMGSRFTENEEAMSRLMQCIKKKDLFFVDSRTTPLTVAYQTALKMGVRTAQRRVFLDNEKDVESTLVKIEELGHTALLEGKAIGIGHPRPTTIAALREGIPALLARGVKIVPVSELLE